MRKNKGFTLIELLVVVAIMGLLAALGVIALNQARARARDARRVSDVKQIQTALELYYLDNDSYPQANGVNTIIDIGGACLSANLGFNSDGTCTGTTYMAVVPSNPAPENDGDNCEAVDYSYTRNGTGGLSYTIDYCLGSAVGDVTGDNHNATPAGLVDD